jgi:hypothetical protein
LEINVLDIQNTGGIASQVFQVVQVIPLTSYTLSSWFASNAVPLVNGFEGIGFYNSTNHQWNNPILGFTDAAITTTTTWQPLSETVMAPANPDLASIEFAVVQVFYANTAGPQGSTLGFVDDVSLNAVPEPASMALLALGLSGLLFIRRRKAA